MTQSSSYEALYKQLGYRFNEPKHLALALTHRSAGKQHNERLEYLGDAVLGMVIAKALFERFPKQPEGNLTRMRASLVKGDTLAKLGKAFALGDYLKLGPGELKSGGFRRSSILADAVEAIIGAMYLDAGIDTCEERILAWFDDRLASLNPDVHLKDDKTRLQEYLQGRRQPLPDYEVTDISGKDHDQTFTVSCTVKGLKEPTVGQGNSRRRAEQQAAKKALEALTDG